MRVSCGQQSNFVLPKRMRADHVRNGFHRSHFPFFTMVYLSDVGFPHIGELSAYLEQCTLALRI